MDDLTQRSKVKLNYELPDEVVEDYTYEMGRLKFKVNTRYCLCFCEHFTRMTGIVAYQMAHVVFFKNVSFAATPIIQLNHDYN